MKKVFWRSWCKFEAAWELERIKTLPVEHEWVDAHIHQNPGPNDIWLTTNGGDYKPGAFKTATWIAESYIYLKNVYDNKAPTSWNYKFHFNPFYCKGNTLHQGIGTWWLKEMSLYEEVRKNKDPKYQFGMVLSKKPTTKSHPCELGWIRSDIVNKARNRSFRYYGGGWDKSDPNYGGEAFVNGHRGSPEKFHDARILMKDCKFVIAVENIHDSHYAVNYLTEKIWHGFISCSVPIYAGCWNVESVISPDLFIDLRKFNMDINAAMDYCEKMPDSEYYGYLDRIGDFLRGPGRDFSCDQRFIQLDKKLTQVFK